MGSFISGDQPDFGFIVMRAWVASNEDLNEQHFGSLPNRLPLNNSTARVLLQRWLEEGGDERKEEQLQRVAWLSNFSSQLGLVGPPQGGAGCGSSIVAVHQRRF